MSEKRQHPEVGDWKLERFLLGELSPEETDRIGRLAQSDMTVKDRIERLRESNAEFLERYPADRMVAEIRRKAAQPAGPREAALDDRRRFRLRAVPALSLAAAAAAAVVIVLFAVPPDTWRGGTHEKPVPTDGTRIKGLDPQILVFRKTATGSERLEDGARAGEHDLLLIQYVAAGWLYGTILSIDGRGTVTRHLPLEGSRPATLLQDGAVSLDFSYELDDAPAWERFYFVTSDSSFDLHVVLDAARETSGAGETASDSLDLPRSFHQTIFTLEKEAGHE